MTVPDCCLARCRKDEQQGKCCFAINGLMPVNDLTRSKKNEDDKDVIIWHSGALLGFSVFSAFLVFWRPMN
jgi:hypothetical protein